MVTEEVWCPQKLATVQRHEACRTRGARSQAAQKLTPSAVRDILVDCVEVRTDLSQIFIMKTFHGYGEF
jgi:hypothetical protein